jgi:hypothetical protein
MRDEQFEFRPRNSTSLQLVRLVERITRNFGEKKLTSAVFLDVANAFDSVWIDGLLYNLTIRNFPSYLVHNISSYLRDRTFEPSLQTARHLVAACWLGGGRRVVLSPPYSYYRHVSQAGAARHYLESYPSDLQRWMSE